MKRLLTHFDSPVLRYWHDIGHGQIRENLGLIAARHWVQQLSPWLAGFHVHDVAQPATDHLMPPEGTIEFSGFTPFVHDATVCVLEPAPGTPASEVSAAVETIRGTWGPPADPAPAA
jgi:sugar phosphate isomerase/epimerase